jgi:serine/threonine-protein kinase
MSREALAMSLVQDPHVVRILDVGRTEAGLPFLSMEWLEGADLGKILANAGSIPVPTAVSWIRQACEGLAQAHRRGIVHRDLKPENLFLASGPNGESVVKVIDFGVSKLDGTTAELTQTQASIGTPLYMSPEQIRALRDVDARADVWALGVVLFELLAGHPPFEAESSEAVIAAIIADPPSDLTRMADVPLGLWDVLLRALSKDRERRFQTVEAFAEALEPFEAEQLEPAPTLVTELPPDFDLLVGEPPAAPLDSPNEERRHDPPSAPTPASVAPVGPFVTPSGGEPSARSPSPTSAPQLQRPPAPAPPTAQSLTKPQRLLAGAGLMLAAALVATLFVLGRERRASRSGAPPTEGHAEDPTLQSVLADASAAPRNPTCILRASTGELVGIRPLEARKIIEDLDPVLGAAPSTIRLATKGSGAPGEILAWNASPLIAEVNEGGATVLVTTDRGLYASVLDSPGVELLDGQKRERLLDAIANERPGVLVLAEGGLPVTKLRETLALLRGLPRVGLLVPVKAPPQATAGAYACSETHTARPASEEELTALREGLRAGEESCGRDHPFDAWLPVRVRMLPGADAGVGCWEKSSRASAEVRVCAATLARRLSLAATRGNESVAFDVVPRGPEVRALCD